MIPGLMELLKMFGGPGNMSPGQPTGLAENPPDNSMLSAYREHTDSMPEYSDYKPSFGRKLGAGLIAAFTNPELGFKVRDANYNTAVADWDRKHNAISKGIAFEGAEDRSKLGWMTALARDENTKRETDRKIASDEMRMEANDVAARLKEEANALREQGMQNTKEYQDKLLEIRAAEGEDRKTRTGLMAKGMRETERHNRENERLRGQKKSTVSPGQQGTLQKQALQNHLINFPEDRAILDKFNDEKTRGSMTPEENDRLRDIFNIINQQVRVKSGTPSPLDSPDDDFDYEVIEDE